MMETNPIEPTRLLVVEDDLELRTVLERSARRFLSSLEIDWASDARQARSWLRGRQYDGVLVDYILGRFERGTDVIRWCRRTQARAEVAVMSSTSVPELLALVDDPSLRLLPKPFTTNEFVSFLEALLESRLRCAS